MLPSHPPGCCAELPQSAGTPRFCLGSWWSRRAASGLPAGTQPRLIPSPSPPVEGPHHIRRYFHLRQCNKKAELLITCLKVCGRLYQSTLPGHLPWESGLRLMLLRLIHTTYYIFEIVYFDLRALHGLPGGGEDTSRYGSPMRGRLSLCMQTRRAPVHMYVQCQWTAPSCQFHWPQGTGGPVGQLGDLGHPPHFPTGSLKFEVSQLPTGMACILLWRHIGNPNRLHFPTVNRERSTLGK